MSSFIRGEIFDWLIGSIQLSNNILLNIAITSVLGTILYVITYRLVGGLYRASIIDGRFAGKVAYLIIFIINVFITAIVLRIIKWIIWLYHYILTVPLWIWLSIAGGIFIIVAIIILARNTSKSKAKHTL